MLTIFSVILISIAIMVMIGVREHLDYKRTMKDVISRLFREGRPRLFVVKSLYKLGYPEKMILNGIQDYLDTNLIEREKVILTKKQDDGQIYYRRNEK